MVLCRPFGIWLKPLAQSPLKAVGCVGLLAAVDGMGGTFSTLADDHQTAGVTSGLFSGLRAVSIRTVSAHALLSATVSHELRKTFQD